MLDSLNTAFIGENFGDANEKAYMEIRTYGEASLTQVFPIWPPIQVSHFAPPFLSPHHTRYFCRFQCCAWVEDVFTHRKPMFPPPHIYHSDSSQLFQFYDWVENVFTPALLPAEYYDGTSISEQEQRVTAYNRLVGAVRLRQLRIKPNTGCSIGTAVQASPASPASLALSHFPPHVTRYSSYTSLSVMLLNYFSIARSGIHPPRARRRG